MYLKNLNCIQFKNHLNKSFNFSPHINLIVGNNGVGKTNILDAIHYLSTTKSASNSTDSSNVMHGKNHFSIDGIFFKKNNEYHIPCLYSEKKLIFKINGSTCKTKKEYIGKFPSVFICPDDKDSIKWGSSVRRKIFDIMICQMNKQYLNDLIEYNKFLKQRNALLKRFAETGVIDKNLIGFYDQNICGFGKRVYKERKKFIKDFESYFINRYKNISNTNEMPSIKYISQFDYENFEELYKNSFEKDLILKHTSMGIHRDDYDFLLNNYNIKNEASQGQKKTFFVSLRLAQRDIIFNNLKIKPLLLMDDVFEKLDDLRITNIINSINDPQIGQVFITTAFDVDKLKGFKQIEKNVNILKIN